MSRIQCLVGIAFLIVGLTLVNLAQGATFTQLVLGNNYTVVEADPFLSGGAAGNTVDMNNPGQFWAQNVGGNVNGLYSWRDFGNIHFNAPAGTLAADRDLFEVGGQPNGVPNLRTTISGLVNGSYNVFLVHIVRTDGSSLNASLLADIDLGQVAPTTKRDETSAGIIVAPFANGVYSVALQPLGSISGTSFSALVGPTSIPYPAGVRGDYIGIAYAPVPEPAAIALGGIGMISMLSYGLRKRRVVK
jgi:hypothetical protein